MLRIRKRLLALLCAVLLALPLLVQPVARADSWGEWILNMKYPEHTKYIRQDYEILLYRAPYGYEEDFYGYVPANQSMMVKSLWQHYDKPSIVLYYIWYREKDTLKDVYGFVPVPSVRLQDEPYPWSEPVYHKKDLYVINKDKTPCYRSPWKRPDNIRGWLDKGHEFRVYTFAYNPFDTVPFTKWLRVSEMDAFIEADKATYVGPILHTKNDLDTRLPYSFAQGEKVSFVGTFQTNWPIKIADTTITLGGETVFSQQRDDLGKGIIAYGHFLNTDRVSELPANDAPYELNISATVAAPNPPHPEKTISIVEKMRFLIYQPATGVSFERGQVTAAPGDVFENPVLMQPDNTTYKNSYSLTAEDDTIVRIDQEHLPVRFTALKEGNTRIHVRAHEPNHDVAAAFELTVTKYGAATLRGDANDDKTVDILDLVSIIEFIVNGTPCPSMANADANGDSSVDILDLVWIIDELVGI